MVFTIATCTTVTSANVLCCFAIHNRWKLGDRLKSWGTSPPLSHSSCI